MPKKLTQQDFDARWMPEPNSGCWLWLGSVNTHGYGMFGYHGTAHRISYETAFGPIPVGLQLDHLCRVRCCVNPEHLEVVTVKENLHRSPLWNGNKITCRRGHARIEENLQRRRDGTGLRCLICDRENSYRGYLKRKNRRT